MVGDKGDGDGEGFGDGDGDGDGDEVLDGEEAGGTMTEFVQGS